MKTHRIKNIKHPNLEDIPKIALYMDQVVEYLDQVLSPLKRSEEDLIMTKTMINNYVKSQLIQPPIKKKYPYETLCHLIMIYHLKQCFTIQDTQIMLSGLIHKVGIEKTYQTFIHFYDEIVSHIIDSKKVLEKEEKIIYTALESCIKKQHTEFLIDDSNTKKAEVKR